MSSNTELTKNLENFIPRLLVRADKQISSALKRKFDAEDAVASLCRSLIRREQEGQFKFSDNEELWKLVVVALKRKIYNKVREFAGTDMRSIDKEEPFDQFAFLTSISREPGPEDAAVFDELLRHIEARVDTECMAVLERKLAGMNNREIAKNLDCSERTIGRKLNVLREVIPIFFED